MNEEATLSRDGWIDAFVSYVIGLAPMASVAQVRSKAERLFAHLGEYGPIEVAEAEWDDLPLPEARGSGACYL
jgi:hypothetical protein